MIEIQKQGLMMTARNNDRNAEIKEKQLMINEQKVMIDASKSGAQTQATLVKAAAEVRRAEVDKDIAILNHANEMRNSHRESQSANK